MPSRASYAKHVRREILEALKMHGPMEGAELTEAITLPDGCPSAAVRTALNYLQNAGKITYTLGSRAYSLEGDARPPPRGSTTNGSEAASASARRAPAARTAPDSNPEPAGKTRAEPMEAPPAGDPEPDHDENLETLVREADRDLEAWAASEAQRLMAPTGCGMRIWFDMVLTPEHVLDLGPHRMLEITRASTILLHLDAELRDQCAEPADT